MKDGVRFFLCRGCGKWKPESRFYPTTDSYYKITSKCKPCFSAVSMAYQRKKSEATPPKPLSPFLQNLVNASKLEKGAKCA